MSVVPVKLETGGDEVNKRFENKVVVVTGAAQGIGEAYARALAREGAAVVVADLNAEAGEQVAKQIEADGGRAIFVPCDEIGRAHV